MTVHVYRWGRRWVARCAGGIAYGESEHAAFWALVDLLSERGRRGRWRRRWGG